MRIPQPRAVARILPSGAPGVAMLAVLAAVAVAGCARKGDPVPPADAVRSDAPQLIAPGEVTRPIQDLQDF
ncbi:hypothetical protein [Albimonas pacifica]|uniref:Lipoprotein-attachment site-containing protein n=1 Tax=Albimonas pacifica TaxID=1114924 RepID=A0A1I3IRU4_9RHOB|nr:hypothetical protein [Albimonas pacifica]SFI50622.1 hypothetical protein SAMN05216258_107192 [Albimonas pacifica]